MRVLGLLVILFMATVSRADIVYLRGGSCHYGEVIRRDGETLIFREVLPGGKGSVVRHLAMSRVARLDHNGRRQVPPTPKQPERDEANDAIDYDQVFREGVELIRDGDYASATRALQMIVLDAPAAALKHVERRCEATFGRSLANLLAALRVRVAGSVQDGLGFRLLNATQYEQPALARVLQQQAATLLARKHAGRTIADWAAEPTLYEELHTGARSMVIDVTRAAALIAARLRFDETLAEDRAQRIALSELRRALMRLSTHVRTKTGFNRLPPPTDWVDPAAAFMNETITTTQPAERGAAQTTTQKVR